MYRFKFQYICFYKIKELGSVNWSSNMKKKPVMEYKNGLQLLKKKPVMEYKLVRKYDK